MLGTAMRPRVDHVNPKNGVMPRLMQNPTPDPGPLLLCDRSGKGFRTGFLAMLVHQLYDPREWGFSPT